MKPRPTQLGTRENTASSRQHASRLVVTSSPLQSRTISINGHREEQSSASTSPAVEPFDLALSGPTNAATGGKERSESQLLNVHEVAELLQVPVSWVYGRTRQRCIERIPGFRLGKYWRFNEADVLAWIQRQRLGIRENA